MPRRTMFQQAQLLIDPIRVVSMGRLAHEALCGDRLRGRAAAAIDAARQPELAPFERYSRVMHASGLVGAAGLRIAARPVTLSLDLLVGTGRHRYTGPDAPHVRPQVSYFEALINHPLDTGLLGLLSAFNLAKHAMIAGCIGAALGAVAGVVLWPFRGYPNGEPIVDFVQVWIHRGAFYVGSLGALMGSCLIWAPHNFLVMQGLRVLTAVPKLVAQAAGYVVGVGLGLACLLVHDGCRALGQALQSWAPAALRGAQHGAQAAPSMA